MSRTYTMKDLAAALTARGVAPVEYGQSGGNCATMFIGTPYQDTAGEWRNPLLAGPGWMTADDAEFSTGEFYIGPDDDGETDATPVDPDATIAQIADQITTALAMTHHTDED